MADEFWDSLLSTGSEGAIATAAPEPKLEPAKKGHEALALSANDLAQMIRDCGKMAKSRNGDLRSKVCTLAGMVGLLAFAELERSHDDKLKELVGDGEFGYLLNWGGGP